MYLGQVARVTTLLGNPEGPVKLGNPNNYNKVKLCLFLFIPAQEIVCREIVNEVGKVGL